MGVPFSCARERGEVHNDNREIERENEKVGFSWAFSSRTTIGNSIVKTAKLLFACAALMVCNAAFADPIGYTETFNSGSNMDWGTDYGTSWANLFSSNYDEDGAAYSSTGGHSGGYVFQNVASDTYSLIFADSDASSGALAGNKNYSTFPRLEAYVTATGDYIDSWVDLFFASTGDSNTNPVGAANLTVYTTQIRELIIEYFPWTLLTGDLTNPSEWTRVRGSADWSSAIIDVDVVGVFVDVDLTFGTNRVMVDDFVGTPEPGLLLTMAPMAGFLGWRLRRRSRRNPTG